MSKYDYVTYPKSAPLGESVVALGAVIVMFILLLLGTYLDNNEHQVNQDFVNQVAELTQEECTLAQKTFGDYGWVAAPGAKSRVEAMVMVSTYAWNGTECVATVDEARLADVMESIGENEVKPFILKIADEKEQAAEQCENFEDGT